MTELLRSAVKSLEAASAAAAAAKNSSEWDEALVSKAAKLCREMQERVGGNNKRCREEVELPEDTTTTTTKGRKPSVGEKQRQFIEAARATFGSRRFSDRRRKSWRVHADNNNNNNNLEQLSKHIVLDEPAASRPRQTEVLRRPFVFAVGHLFVYVMAPIYATFRETFPLHWGWHVANVVSEATCVLDVRSDPRMMVVYSPVWTLSCAVLPFLSTQHREACHVVTAYVKALQGLASLTLHARSTEDPTVARIAKLAFLFLAVIQYVSCGYHAISVHSRSSHRVLGRFAYYGQRGSTVVSRWFMCYYWAVSVVLGNSTLPSSGYQAFFHVFVFLLGITMTSLLTGSITSLVANADLVATKRQQKLFSMRKFFQDYAVNPKLAETILGYYRYKWEADYDASLFDDLTDALKLRLNLATKRQFIANCPIFKGLDQSVVIRLVTALKQRILVPQEIVAAQGEVGDSMYFVSRGTLRVTVDNKNIVVGRLFPGDHFGESALLSQGGVRNATVTSDDYTELFCLSRSVLALTNDDRLRRTIAASIQSRKLRTHNRKMFHRLRLKLICCARFVKLLDDLRNDLPADILRRGSDRSTTTTTKRGVSSYSYYYTPYTSSRSRRRRRRRRFSLVDYARRSFVVRCPP
ncbi:hypothetical protein CTAYLR_001720 [Chrysophaeum taylorii]|uniref:Cyclic nucleotide-binding domain-containing protein n=1 Tax=Chrysophaeum taylorii TaxID=2483200 RepID=A0AAD7U5H2_9STRA|nr:hypothetical protein CTAYLR_001720 [Chrysophaeum taylorii]